jgi:orotidine-5'-phosphate decarboxylase
MGFFDRLADRIAAADSVVSVGLDPDPDRLPASVADADLPRWAFNRRIIDATHEYAACYKPNAAFYEDPDGWRALVETVAYAHGKDVPVLLDAKRADIGNTARRYAAVLDTVDAITVNPYLGRDALEPFLGRGDAGVFVLARTSNPGGSDLQDLELAAGDHLYERVATLADTWNREGNVGLVVGATAPEELAEVRELVPELPFLVPGVGAQGGDAEAAVDHGLASWPGADVDVGLVNSSRGIIFAGEDAGGPHDRAAPGDGYFDAAGAAARRLQRRLNEFR